MKSTTFRLLPIAAITSVLWACSGGNNFQSPAASTSGNSSNTSGTPSGTSSNAAMTLLVSRGVYDANYDVSGPLPYSATPETPASSPTVSAVSPGTFPNVFTNDANDANFGVTADYQIDEWAPGATSPTLYMDVTQAAQQQGYNLTTSFSSKSEGALNVSQDGTAITFNEYNAPIDQIDRSNSNTPGVIDPTNTDIATPTYRTVVQLNLANKTLQFTNTNGYSGNNGRASVLANGKYYIVGNAGNSGSSPSPTYAILDQLTQDTGVQSITPGSSCPFTQVIGAFQTGNGSTYAPAASGTCSLGTITDSLSSQTYSKKTSYGGNQFGFSLASVSGQTFDKTGKDNNYRGLYLAPNGTLYVSKGSGGNGVNTVYQVGATGALANGGTLSQSAAITIPPGFLPSGWSGAPAAANLTPVTSQWPTSWGIGYPFGMWMPANNQNLMFVADEGDGAGISSAAIGSGGLWVYQNTNGTWAPIAHITQGLNLGVAYTVSDSSNKYNNPGVNYTTTPDGLRNITGQVNADGSITIYAITSTIGNSLGAAFDAGADSNQLVKITLSVNGSTVTTSGFTLLETAPYGQVLRGVALVPKA